MYCQNCLRWEEECEEKGGISEVKAEEQWGAMKARKGRRKLKKSENKDAEKDTTLRQEQL